MTTVGDIYDEINRFAPFDTAEDWDHVGLLIGDRQRPVDRALLALDAADTALITAAAGSFPLLITHHPVIFHPLSHVSEDSPVYRLISSGTAVISAHTNLDKAPGGINDVLAQTLGLTGVTVQPDGYCRIGTMSPASPVAFARWVGGALHTGVRLREGTNRIKTVLVCSGGGGDLALPYTGCVDAIVTGELHHHEWLNLPEQLTLIEAGHFATELPGLCHYDTDVSAPACLFDRLRQAFPSIEFVPHMAPPPYVTLIKD